MSSIVRGRNLNTVARLLREQLWITSKVKTVLGGLLLLSVLLTPRPVHALDLGKALRFSVGVAGGILLHEVGHWAMGRIVGGETQITSPFTTRMSMSPPDAGAFQWFSLGGYLMQSALSEYILATPSLHQNDIALGMMFFGFTNNLSNVAQYYLSNSTDLAGYQAWGGNANIPAALMTVQSVYGLHRIFQETEIVPHLLK